MQTEIREKTIEVRDQLGAEVKRVKEAVADAVEKHQVPHGQHAARIDLKCVPFRADVPATVLDETH